MISPAPLTRSARSSQEDVPSLVTRLAQTRRRVACLRCVILACLAASLFLLLAAVMAAFDYFLVVPWAVRAGWLAFVAVGTLTSVVIAWRTWITGFQLRNAAVAVEQARPMFGQRFRTFLDYNDPVARPSLASPRLVSALAVETENLATEDDFARVGRQQPLARAASVLCLVLAAWCLGLVAGPECRTAAGRTFLAPWNYTQVTVDPLEATVVEGSDVPIRIQIAGRPIRSGLLRYRPSNRSQDWTNLALQNPVGTDREDKSDGSATVEEMFRGEYTLVIRDCRESLDFEVDAGPLELPPGSIQVLQPLRVQKFSAQVAPPLYTGLPTSDVELAQFQVQEGSLVSFKLLLNRPPAEVLAELHSAGEDDPQASGKITWRVDERTIYGEIPDIRRTLTFDVCASAADGMQLEPYRVHIRVQPDTPPSVRFLQPVEDLEVLATSEVPMLIEASDDLGLHKVGIGFQVAGGPMQLLWEYDSGGQQRTLQSREVLALEEHDVHFPGSIDYYAFAEDNYFGEPRRSVTPLRFIDIRPFKREYQLLDNGGT